MGTDLARLQNPNNLVYAFTRVKQKECTRTLELVKEDSSPINFSSATCGG